MKTQITLQEMEKEIIKTKRYAHLKGYFLDLMDLELCSGDDGSNAYYTSKKDAKDDLLDSFENNIAKADWWVDILSDGSYGEVAYATEQLYNHLIKDKTKKKAGNAAVIRK